MKKTGRMRKILLLTFCLMTNAIFGQLTFNIDSLAEVNTPFSFEIESNQEGRIEIIDVDGLQIIGRSSGMSTSITNGKATIQQNLKITALAQEERKYTIIIGIREEGVIQETLQRVVVVGNTPTSDTKSKSTKKGKLSKPKSPKKPRKMKRI